MQFLSLVVAELNSPLGDPVASKKDRAIKMTQRQECGHGQGNIHYIVHISLLSLGPSLHTAQSPLLICIPFIASIPHTENSLETDRVTSVQSLINRLTDAEDNGYWPLCVEA